MQLHAIVDAPPRGLGRLAATLLEEPATAAELPGRAADFGPAAVSSAATLMATIFDLHAEASRGTAPATLLDRALDRSGYRAWLERHPDGIRRLQTLGRLRALAARAEVPVGEWLDAVVVGEELGAVEEEATHLSSVHLAKAESFWPPSSSALKRVCCRTPAPSLPTALIASSAWAGVHHQQVAGRCSQGPVRALSWQGVTSAVLRQLRVARLSKRMTQVQFAQSAGSDPRLS